MTVAEMVQQTAEQEAMATYHPTDAHRTSFAGTEAAHGGLLPTSSRGTDEWGGLLAGFGGTGLPMHESILKFPSLDLGPLPPTFTAAGSGMPVEPYVGTIDHSLKLETQSRVVSSECTPEASADIGDESGSEQGRSPGKHSRGVTGRKRVDPERSARLREERAVRKRQASKRRYAEQKSRLDFLQAREAGLRAQNETLRQRLASIRAEIAQLSE